MGRCITNNSLPKGMCESNGPEQAVCKCWFTLRLETLNAHVRSSMLTLTILISPQGKHCKHDAYAHTHLAKLYKTVLSVLKQHSKA